MGFTNVSPTIGSLNHRIIESSANRLVRPFFAAAFVLMVIVAMISDGIYDIGDGITHFEIAKWSWKHPELFLHHWGKPFFTLLASPFAQFGYKGVVLFNVVCHVLTAWVAWRIGDRMKLPYAFLIGPLVIFAPVSWGVAQSGLTEPLFALTLMAGIYFITGGRNITAAIIISLLPLARTEGFFIAPLFGLFFLIRRDYVSMALLAAGTLFYSILGALFVHDDFLWLIHGNPYTGESAYGHGGLFHFVDQNEFIMGWAMALFSVPGLLTLFLRKRIEPAHSIVEIILVFGSFVVFFVLHSVMWWKGWAGSYGLIRVMACIIPCIALVSLRGLQLVTRLYEKRTAAVAATLIATIGITVFNTMNHHGLVLQPDEQQQDCIAVAEAAKKEDPSSRTVYFGHPLVRFLLEKDPYDPAQSREIWDLPNGQVSGALIIWESGFGEMQYDLTEEELLAFPNVHEITRMDFRERKNGVLWIICEVE